MCTIICNKLKLTGIASGPALLKTESQGPLSVQLSAAFPLSFVHLLPVAVADSAAILRTVFRIVRRLLTLHSYKLRVVGILKKVVIFNNCRALLTRYYYYYDL